jgi:hypothetical protein
LHLPTVRINAACCATARSQPAMLLLFSNSAIAAAIPGTVIALIGRSYGICWTHYIVALREAIVAIVRTARSHVVDSVRLRIDPHRCSAPRGARVASA